MCKQLVKNDLVRIVPFPPQAGATVEVPIVLEVNLLGADLGSVFFVVLTIFVMRFSVSAVFFIFLCFPSVLAFFLSVLAFVA